MNNSVNIVTEDSPREQQMRLKELRRISAIQRKEIYEDN